MSTESDYNDATAEDAAVDEIAKWELEGYEGQTWTADQLRAEFEVVGYAAPFVVVRRRSDNVEGTLEFVHWPRRYFGWQA